MTAKVEPSVRLYVLLARKAPRAVVFRRGPTRQVLLVSWETDKDAFREGQWLKGRIYERRCDLSPSGKRLIYFAADYKEPYYSWTAVSRPPFLTALALWPKGDAWGGGGLFAKESEILLNHRSDEMKLAVNAGLPKWVNVKPLVDRPGWGEDSPIMDYRLLRDGWRLIQEGKTIEHKLGAPLWIEFDPPQVWVKPCPLAPNYELRMVLCGIHERNGPSYVIEHSVVEKTSGGEVSLGRTDWADWCQSGDLLFAREGMLFRLGWQEGKELHPIEEAKILIDLSDRKFAPKEAPPEATNWGSDVSLA